MGDTINGVNVLSTINRAPVLRTSLDSFLMSEAQIRWSFSYATEDSDIAVIEGVRGVYEGLNAIDDIGSTAHIAKILKVPIILVIDIRGITKSAAAYILGFKQLDPQVNIAGVILNKFSTQTHAKKTVAAIKKFVKVPVIGTIPKENRQGIFLGNAQKLLVLG